MWGEGASRRGFEVSWKCVVYAIVVEVRGAYQGLKRRVYLSGELGSTVNVGLSWENSCFSTSRKCTSHLQVLFRARGRAAGGQTQKKHQAGWVGSKRGVVCSRTRQEGQAARTTSHDGGRVPCQLGVALGGTGPGGSCNGLLTKQKGVVLLSRSLFRSNAALRRSIIDQFLVLLTSRR